MREAKEIKFRLRDKAVHDWLLIGDNIEEINNRGDATVSHGDCVRMQYTGLKDKSGKEIYEGDIIDGFTVSYSGDLNEGLGMNCGRYLQQDDFERWTPLESKEDYEVVGNIYETPELLERTSSS